MTRFTWDAGKAADNLRKHGVSFDEAETVFENPFYITVSDPDHSRSEARERTIGISQKLRTVVVIHTERQGGVVRLISARKADKRETQDYENEIKHRFG